MSYQLCIINPAGATLRTGPSTNGGTIRGVKHGEIFDIMRLIFVKPQSFDANYIPNFQEALQKGLVVGDVWCHVTGLQLYQGKQVPGFVALRVENTTYGVLAGSVVAKIPALNDHEARVAEIDEMIRYLAVRRAELSK